VGTAALPADPIVTRSGPSVHNHIFFGNKSLVTLAQRDLAAGRGFTNLSDANLEPASAGNTTCEDTQDTAAMWLPEFFYKGKQRIRRAIPGGGPCTTGFSCSPYTRTYYENTSVAQSIASAFIPDKYEAVNGDPGATGTPTITSSRQADAYMQNQEWTCGAQSRQTPRSPWPYSCALFYKNTGIQPEDGLAMIVGFPDCVSANTSSWDNLDGGPFYAPKGVSTMRDNMVFANNAICPAGYQLIPSISLRFHTLLEYEGTTTEPIFNPASTASRLPSCYSQDLAGPCTNTPPRASDLLFGFASDAAGNGQGALCAVPVRAGCGWYTGHADYMDMWQQAVTPRWPDPAAVNATLDTAHRGDSPSTALNLDDIISDCDLAPMPSPKCGFVTQNLTASR
jgi:hypothetical protein